MADPNKPLKNSLNIRLAESAIFLRTNDTTGRNRYNDSRPTMLRGLLTLELVKPTRISCIQLELQAKSTTAWPEGVGAHRSDVTESHKVFSATEVIFKAGSGRRTASLGPGVSVDEPAFDDDESAPGTPRDRVAYRAISPSFMSVDSDDARSARTVRALSADSWTRFSTLRGNEPELFLPPLPTPPSNLLPPSPAYSATPPFTPPPLTPPSSYRQTSILTTSSTNSSYIGSSVEEHSPIFEESRISFKSDIHGDRRKTSGSMSTRSSRTTSNQSVGSSMRSGSRRPSVSDVPEFPPEFDSVAGPSNNEPSFPPPTPSSPSFSHTPSSSDVSRSPSQTRGRRSRFSFSAMSSRIINAVRSRSRANRKRSTSRSQSKNATDGDGDRERSPSRLSTRSGDTSVRDKDTRSVHSLFSRRKQSHSEAQETSSIVSSASRGRSRETRPKPIDAMSTRSLPVAPLSPPPPSEFGVLPPPRSASTLPPTPSSPSAASMSLPPPSIAHSRRASSRASADRVSFGVFGNPRAESLMEKKDGDGWKEFKAGKHSMFRNTIYRILTSILPPAGTYTYPICFQIPGHAPPSLECSYGSVTWRLKANVHRPGAFSTKMATQRDVLVISCPSEEDTEDTENIIVERHWDQQLQYLISISGRSFHIGGSIPVSFTLLPLAKVKIHRISVVVEQKVEYHTHFKRVARTDPVTTIPLLSLREEGKDAPHILPLESDDVDALTKSPMFPVIDQTDDVSEMASTLMGPGPWTFHQDLALPPSCKSMNVTNKNKRSNITVTHQLKCVIRVERGDNSAIDAKTGKRKLFDIVIQTPVQILSCRCNPDWTSLPHYSTNSADPSRIASQCPCMARKRQSEDASSRAEGIERMSSDSSASHAESSPLPNSMFSLRNRDNLIVRNQEFEDLVAGHLDTSGEAPPAYTIACPFTKAAMARGEGVTYSVVAVV